MDWNDKRIKDYEDMMDFEARIYYGANLTNKQERQKIVSAILISEELNNLLFDISKEKIEKIYNRRDSDIEFILRNKIDKPIKGEITIGKLRWRGIKNIAYGENFAFLGIIQRGKLITKE